MTLLEEMKLRLNISGTEQDPKLQILLDDAIDFVQRTTGKTFVVDGVLILPPVVKNIIAAMLKSDMTDNTGIKRESMDGMSIEYKDDAATGNKFDVAKKALIEAGFVAGVTFIRAGQKVTYGT